MDNVKIQAAIKVLCRALVARQPQGTFSAFDSDNGLYGVEHTEHYAWGTYSGIVYEPDMTEFQAKLVAWFLNQDEALGWDDIAPLVMLFEQE